MASWSSAFVVGFVFITVAAGESSLRGMKVKSLESPSPFKGKLKMAFTNIIDNKKKELGQQEATTEVDVSSVEEGGMPVANSVMKLCGVAAGATVLTACGLAVGSPTWLESTIDRDAACKLRAPFGVGLTGWCNDMYNQGGFDVQKFLLDGDYTNALDLLNKMPHGDAKDELNFLKAFKTSDSESMINWLQSKNISKEAKDRMIQLIYAPDSRFRYEFYDMLRDNRENDAFAKVLIEMDKITPGIIGLPDTRGTTVLHETVEANAYEALKTFMSSGQVTDDILLHKDKDGQTVLHRFAERTGGPPLMDAEWNAERDAVKALLNKSKENQLKDVVNKNGEKAADIAMRNAEKLKCWWSEQNNGDKHMTKEMHEKPDAAMDSLSPRCGILRAVVNGN